MEAEPGAELPLITYQLAEQYQLGQPLALFTMPPRWVHSFQIIKCALLCLVIGLALYVLVFDALFLSQYLILFSHPPSNVAEQIRLQEQVADLSWRFMLSLPGMIIAMIGCIAFILVRSMLVRELPASLLVCSEGLLEIRPGETGVTRWNEVRGTLQETPLRKSKKYKLDRINRKSLTFGESFEDVERLAGLIRQHIQKT